MTFTGHSIRIHPLLTFSLTLAFGAPREGLFGGTSGWATYVGSDCGTTGWDE